MKGYICIAKKHHLCGGGDNTNCKHIKPHKKCTGRHLNKDSACIWSDFERFKRDWLYVGKAYCVECDMSEESSDFMKRLGI